MIHGLGFSTFLRAVLGEEESIALPLFSFNVGLEIGQVVILSGILVLTYAMVRGLGVKSKESWDLLLYVRHFSNGEEVDVSLADMGGSR